MSNRQTTFLLKKSGVAGKIPTQLLLGEIAINFADAKLYTSGTTANSILPIGWDRVSKTGDTMTGTLFVPTVSATTYLNLPSAGSGTVTGSSTAGYVSFWNSPTGIFGSSSLFWDNSNKYLGIGTVVPQAPLHVSGSSIIDAGVTTNTDVMFTTGSINSYLEYNIQNKSSAVSAQTGYGAMADNGTLTTGFVWMGINNSTFNAPAAFNIGGPNDTSFLGSGQDMYIANTNNTKSIIFSTGIPTAPYFQETMRITSTDNLLIGTTGDTGQRLNVSGSTLLNGQQTLKGILASDSAPLGSELLTSASGSGWSGSGWNSGGYTNSGSNTNTLISTFIPTIGSFYRLTFNLSVGATYSWSFAGIGISTSGGNSFIQDIQATSTAPFTLSIPSGTLTVATASIKAFSSSSATTIFLNSSGTIVNEIRASSSSTNYFSGLNVGLKNATGTFNTGVGSNSLVNNFGGVGNTTVGSNSLYYNIIGGYNTVMGYNAGTFIANKSTSATSVGTSVMIGYNTGPLADSQTNQIVIGYNSTGLGSNTTVLGNTSTLTSAIYGNLLLGGTVSSGAKLQVSGNTLITGNLTATTISATTYLNMPAATFSGGTVTGPTNFTNGVTANTISATTYQGLPISVVNTTNLFSTGLSNTGSGATATTNSIFFGNSAGQSATNANNSNFFGTGAGVSATDASYSNFLGYYAGQSATNANNSNLFGYNVGNATVLGSLGSNNIIIGTNISLSAGTTDSINIGGVLFGSGTYSNTTGNPSVLAQTAGRIGINVVNPTTALHVSGNSIIDAGVTTNTDVIFTTGSINSYLEYNIQNKSNSISAQTGYAATADNGTLTTGFVWMGINNSTFNNPATYNIGVSGDTSFLGSGNDMYIANANQTKSIIFSIGSPTTPYFSETMRITNKNLLIGTSLDAGQKLQVSGDTLITGNLTATTISATTYLNLPGGSKLKGSSIFNFTTGETDTVINTISSTLITNNGINGILFRPSGTTETSLDDFTLNGLSFNIENIIDNTSFDIRANAANNATGNYTINYSISY